MRPRLRLLMLALVVTVATPLAPAKAGPVRLASSDAGCELSWVVVPTPYDPQVGSTLGGVDGASSDDVWATGTYTGAMDGGDPLALHWDGSVWTEVETPALAGWTYLGDVTAISSNDVWAVGSQNRSLSLALVEHWDGRRWEAQTPHAGWLGGGGCGLLGGRLGRRAT